MRALLLLAMLLCATCCFADDNIYNTATIPASLLKQANAIIRNRDIKVKVVSPTEIYTYEKVAFTIMDDKGAKYGRFAEYYNKLITIKDVKGTLYDASGKEIKSLKKRDLVDRAVYDGNFVVDERYKEYDFHYANYPYTVAFEIEKKVSTFFFLLDWEFQPDYNVAVEKTTFEMSYPETQNIKHKVFHIDAVPRFNITGGNAVLSLELSNLPAVKRDAFVVKENYPLPAIVFNTNKLEMGGISGDMLSWNRFGKFFYELNKERDVLPDDKKLVVHQLTDTCRSVKSKINILYKYLQQNSRYVSIQLGVGGWQTMDASFVSKNGYGDCKALSNCMMALLKEAGIISYAALVRAGATQSRRMDLDFPSNVFNHVILCVPYKRDTTWLECTSDNLPAGYLSDFTHDRNVLLITPEGGQVIHTPVYSYNENRVTRKIKMKLKESGELTGEAEVMQYGEFGQDQEELLKTGNSRDKEKMLNGRFELPAYRVDRYEYRSYMLNNIPALNEVFNFSGSTVVTNSGKRIFFNPLITDITNTQLMPEEERTRPFYIRDGYEMLDTTVIVIDGKYEAEHLPKEVVEKYPFGAYEYKPVFENNALTIIRRYRQVAGEYNPELYSQFVKFANSAGNDTHKVVLVKKEN